MGNENADGPAGIHISAMGGESSSGAGEVSMSRFSRVMSRETMSGPTISWKIMTPNCPNASILRSRRVTFVQAVIVTSPFDVVLSAGVRMMLRGPQPSMTRSLRSAMMTRSS